MTRLAGLGLALLWLSILAFGAAPAPNEELRALRSRLEELKRDIARAEGLRSEAADALKTSEQAISDANRRLTELASAEHELDLRLSDLAQQRSSLQARLAGQQQLAARLLYGQYISGARGPFELLAQGLDPNEVARTSVYLGYVARARKTILDGLRNDAGVLAGLTEESAARRRELGLVHSEQVAENARLDNERKNRKQVLAEISSKLERQRREVGSLERDERRLSKLVQDLAKLLAARKPRPRSDTPQASPRTASGDSPFEQLRGRLRPPVRGELVGRFGSPRSDSGLSWRGLFIQAPAGREVKAVAAGRIVFADWLRGFGNLLILDHGDGFMSLYANNEALIGRLGDAVRGGDTVATVGSSGGNAATGLYFELRHEGRPFDPLGWLNLK